MRGEEMFPFTNVRMILIIAITISTLFLIIGTVKDFPLLKTVSLLAVLFFLGFTYIYQNNLKPYLMAKELKTAIQKDYKVYVNNIVITPDKVFQMPLQKYNLKIDDKAEKIELE